VSLLLNQITACIHSKTIGFAVSLIKPSNGTLWDYSWNLKGFFAQLKRCKKQKNNSKMFDVDILWCEHSFANLNISLVALNLRIAFLNVRQKNEEEENWFAEKKRCPFSHLCITKGEQTLTLCLSLVGLIFFNFDT
jgi:hypothetical protein